MFGNNALLRSTDALADVLARAALVVAIARACVAIRQARRVMVSVVGRRARRCGDARCPSAPH
jgi:hypothetical protein